jgi:hypothetical protein
LSRWTAGTVHWIGISRLMRRPIQILPSSDMQDWLTLIVTLTLLLYSVAGQQLARHVSHAHLLIGPVTLEELRAHRNFLFGLLDLSPTSWGIR